LVLGIAAWHLRRRTEHDLFAPVAKVALWATLATGIATVLIGHEQGQLMTRQQPMKMAAAEALYQTKTGAEFSLFALGPWSKYPVENLVNIAVPHGLSILADNSWNGRVEGINDVQRDYEQRYGPGNYKPIVAVTYWSFRIMTGIGFLACLLAAAGLWLARRPGRLENAQRFLRLAVWAIALPFVANLAGWVFTEIGRQPWVVQGLLLTRNAVSPSVSAWSVGITLAGFTLLYGILAAVEGWLMVRAARTGPDPVGSFAAAAGDGVPVKLPALTY
ncbi:MAG: cytochrome ubiquinol oxidase subunit I, partial [Gaiellaceae bacterium]